MPACDVAVNPASRHKRWFFIPTIVLAAGAISIATLLLTSAGCDDGPALPPELLEQDSIDDHLPDDDQSPPPPTTQELTQGQYKTITLTGLPLSMQVPQSWEIESLGAGSRHILMGHAPSGQVQINLSQRPRTTQEKIDIMLEGARKEMAADPQHIKKVNPFTRGEMKIVERQVISRAELPADPSNPTAPSGPMMRWTLTTYIRSGEEFDSYELNFIGLSAQQFKQDESFLRRILDTLEYDASAPAGDAAGQGL